MKKQPSMRQKAAAFDCLQVLYKGDLYEQVCAIVQESFAETDAETLRKRELQFSWCLGGESNSHAISGTGF